MELIHLHAQMELPTKQFVVTLRIGGRTLQSRLPPLLFEQFVRNWPRVEIGGYKLEFKGPEHKSPFRGSGDLHQKPNKPDATEQAIQHAAKYLRQVWGSWKESCENRALDFLTGEPKT